MHEPAMRFCFLNSTSTPSLSFSLHATITFHLCITQTHTHSKDIHSFSYLILTQTHTVQLVKQIIAKNSWYPFSFKLAATLFFVKAR